MKRMVPPKFQEAFQTKQEWPIRKIAMIIAGSVSIISIWFLTHPTRPTAIIDWNQPAIVGESAIQPKPICKKTLRWDMDSLNGLFSELLLLTRAIVVAHWHGYEVLVDDSQWNYGSMKDYFNWVELNCIPPSEQTPREDYCIKGNEVKDHVRMDRSCTDGLDQMLAERIPNETLEVQAVWNFINSGDHLEILPAHQNLHYLLGPLFDLMAAEFLGIWKPNTQILEEVHKLNEDIMKSVEDQRKSRDKKKPIKFIGVHYRLGDKEHEQYDQWMGSQLVGLPPGFNKAERYLKALEEMMIDQGWNSTREEEVMIAVMSDNLEYAIPKLKETMDQNEYFKTIGEIGMIGIRSGTIEEKGGHNQFEFNVLSKERRIELGRAAISEFEWLWKNTKGGVCSVTSNICSALMMLHGSSIDIIGEHPKIRSIDQRWTPTPHLSIVNSPRLNSTQIFKLINRLSENSKNFIKPF